MLPLTANLWPSGSGVRESCRLCGRTENVSASPAVAPRSSNRLVSMAKPSKRTALPFRRASTKLVRPMKPATNRVFGSRVDLVGRVDLLDAALVHHGDAVGGDHGFGLVVRHVDRGDAQGRRAGGGSRSASPRADWRRGWTAARRAAAPTARPRWRAPAPRAAAGRRTARRDSDRQVRRICTTSSTSPSRRLISGAGSLRSFSPKATFSATVMLGQMA